MGDSEQDGPQDPCTGDSKAGPCVCRAQFLQAAGQCPCLPTGHPADVSAGSLERAAACTGLVPNKGPRPVGPVGVCGRDMGLTLCLCPTGYHHNDDDGRYPPRPRPPAGGDGGGGYSGGHGGYGHTDGRGGYRPKPRYGNSYGGDGQSTYGNPQGNTVARIVSPIVSVVVVALVGAGVSYFKSNQRRNCFRASDPETV
uniref:Uncharacterized protein n=1 Tax=Urocitellus parryii TaxID=9999 RepID=A0A8D2KNA1_UROPR